MAIKEQDHADAMDKLNAKHEGEIQNHLNQEQQLENTIVERDETIKQLEAKLADTQEKLNHVSGQIQGMKDQVKEAHATMDRSLKEHQRRT